MGKYGKACWFLECPSRSKRHPTLKFFPFVKPWIDQPKCLRWIAASGKNEPSEHITKAAYVCERHFVDGSPSAENPDPLPFDFSHNPQNDAEVDDPGEPEGQANSNKPSTSGLGTPQRRAAQAIRRKALTPRKSTRVALYRRPSTASQVPVNPFGPMETQHNPQNDAGVNDPGEPEGQANSIKPLTSGPGTPLRRAAQAIRRKALTPRKSPRVAPYRSPSTSSQVPVNPFAPMATCSNRASNMEGCIGVNPAPANVSVSTVGSSPAAPSKGVRDFQRRLFDEYMNDIVGTEECNDDDDGVAPLVSTPPPSSDASSDNCASGFVFEKDGKRSVETQTLSRRQVNRLIEAGKLSKIVPSTSHGAPSEDDSEEYNQEGTPLKRVITSKKGMTITIEDTTDTANKDAAEPRERCYVNSDGSSIRVLTSNVTSMEEQDSDRQDLTVESNDSDIRDETIATDGEFIVDSCGEDEDDIESGLGDSTSASAARKGKGGGPKKKRNVYLSYETVDDEEFEYLCGLSKEKFDLLYTFIGGDEVCSLLKYEREGKTPRQIRGTRWSLKTRLFMTLFRLRRGLSEQMIAILFGCSVSLVSRILNAWINLLFVELKPLEEHMFQDRKSQRRSAPKRFKSFKELRVVVDCTEIEVEAPSNFQQQGNTWSPYKHCNTVKYLIGINVHGAVIYVSEAFEGSMSDKEVFMRSSIYHMLRPGDVVMADRGFNIAHELDMINVKLIIPSYLKGRDYLTPEEEIWTKKIARARIFVENAIGRLKNWRVLNGVFPQSTLPLVSQMVFVCACLCNFLPPLL